MAVPTRFSTMLGQGTNVVLSTFNWFTYLIDPLTQRINGTDDTRTRLGSGWRRSLPFVGLDSLDYSLDYSA
jgi:hypothetical protein